ncbi:cytochrome b5 domain-containing protein [Candidatus Dojkabacteria bacterium]|uniref:Cytochrome b5 domain-containing protein n=1 Tax=Candidatus Dojkabacteria bacterium TaxID=2099670 RepID=A0A955IAP8_9BACT|nr:cytochrome b5 domain-containing protein [Candidatus Dojkabacteria bacterium]
MNYVYKVFYPILALLVLGIILLLGYTFISDSGNTQTNNSTTQTNSTTNTGNSNLTATFTSSDISAANNIKTDCLTVVDGSVYNIPESWAKSHPGGYQEVAMMCGKDATSLFNSQHGRDNTAKNQLSQYFVGVLSN